MDLPPQESSLQSATACEVLLCVAVTREDIVRVGTTGGNPGPEDLRGPGARQREIEKRVKDVVGEGVAALDSSGAFFGLLPTGFKAWVAEHLGAHPPSGRLSIAAQTTLSRLADGMESVSWLISDKQDDQGFLLDVRRLYSFLDRVELACEQYEVESEVAQRISAGRYEGVAEPHVVLRLSGTVDCALILRVLAAAASTLCQVQVAARVRSAESDPWQTVLFPLHAADQGVRWRLDQCSKGVADIWEQTWTEDDVTTPWVEEVLIHHSAGASSVSSRRTTQAFLGKFFRHVEVKNGKLDSLTVELRDGENGAGPAIFLLRHAYDGRPRLSSYSSETLLYLHDDNCSARESFYCPVSWNCPNHFLPDLPWNRHQRTSLRQSLRAAVLSGGESLPRCCCPPVSHPQVTVTSGPVGWRSLPLHRVCCVQHAGEELAPCARATGWRVRRVWRLDVLDG